MKAILLLLAVLFCYSASAQDTIQHVEIIEGKRVIVQEIIHSQTFQKITAIIALSMAIIGTSVFLFTKPKPKSNE